MARHSDGCGDTLPPGTHGLAGRDISFPIHMRKPPHKALDRGRGEVWSPFWVLPKEASRVSEDTYLLDTNMCWDNISFFNEQKVNKVSPK